MANYYGLKILERACKTLSCSLSCKMCCAVRRNNRSGFNLAPPGIRRCNFFIFLSTTPRRPPAASCLLLLLHFTFDISLQLINSAIYIYLSPIPKRNIYLKNKQTMPSSDDLWWWVCVMREIEIIEGGGGGGGGESCWSCKEEMRK